MAGVHVLYDVSPMSRTARAVVQVAAGTNIRNYICRWKIAPQHEADLDAMTELRDEECRIMANQLIDFVVAHPSVMRTS